MDVVGQAPEFWLFWGRSFSWWRVTGLVRDANMALQTRDAMLPLGQYFFMFLREVGQDKEKWDWCRSQFSTARCCIRWGMEIDDLRSAYASFCQARKNPPDRLACLADALMNLSNCTYCICEHIIHLHQLRIKSQKPEFVRFLEWFSEIFDTITCSSAVASSVLRSRALNTKLPKMLVALNLISIPTWLYFITIAHMKRPIPSARVAAFCNIIAGVLRIAVIYKKNRRL